MEFITNYLTTDHLVSLLTLTLLEIVLGIDNVIFISIIASRLKSEEQARARNIGLALALIVRIGLLFSVSWLVSLTGSLFTIFEQEISGRDLILLAGGLFLMGKTVSEIHQKFEGNSEQETKAKASVSFSNTIVQIVLIDIVFSFDSILTAVGLSREFPIMVTAVVLSMTVMFFLSGSISDFIEKHPTIKMLALSFLIMIGMLLVAEAFDIHVPKGYIYFAMAFSLGVEALNITFRKKTGEA
jgi:predicted tellurium resistance membrane protein TerC